MSRSFATKGAGACLKHVLNARLTPVVPRSLAERRDDDLVADRRRRSFVVLKRRFDPPPVRETDPLPPDEPLRVLRSLTLAELYRAQRPRLLRLLRRRTSHENAQDACQEAFSRFAAIDRDRAAAIASPEAYLRRISENLLRNNAVRAARRSDGLHVDADTIELAAPDMLAALEARDMLRRVDAALLKLRPLTREIFMAHRLDGFTYREIAEQTGLSERGVETQMRRAIAKLHRLLHTR